MIKLTIDTVIERDIFFEDIPFAEPFLGTPLNVHPYGLYVKVKSFYDKREILMPLFDAKNGLASSAFGGDSGGKAWYAPSPYDNGNFKITRYQPVSLEIKAVVK